MARLSPEELQRARARKAEERRAEEERRRKEVEEGEQRLYQRDMERQAQALKERDLFNRHHDLTSFATGIYEEVVKFSNKWPHHPVSEMMVTRANRAIKSARDLLAEEPDSYLDEIQELVPAGDDVEAQDVTLALRTILDALERMKSRHSHEWQTFRLHR